jgi:hypothetical protein
MLAHNDLRTVRDTGIELQCINHRQRYLYANATPERDSLFEELQYLRSKYGISDEDITPAFKLVRQGMEANDLELAGERHITGVLDDLASTAHRMVRSGSPTLSKPLKTLANDLRPHLQILATPAGQTSAHIDQARVTVRRIIKTETNARLTSTTLRHELRPTCHDALLLLMERSA